MLTATFRRNLLSDAVGNLCRFSSKATARPARAPRVAPIAVTDRATRRIKEMIEDKDNVVGVKIGVKRSTLTWC
jgi:hypothetical protein